MKLIISGASGDLGRKVTAFALQQRPASDLILLTRNPAALSDEAARGASVRHADFSAPATLGNAMQGGDVLLLISTLSIGKRAEQHANAIAAAKLAGVKHVIYTSSGGVQPQTPSLSGQEHYATEQVLQKSGLAFTILRNSWYADVTPLLLLPAGLATGSLVASTGTGCIAPVAKSDCARAAAAVLLAPDKHANAIYEITGPELLTFTDLARLCSEATGKPIAYVDVSHDEKLAIFDAMGVKRDYEEGMMNEATNAWASNEMITYEMAIKQQFFSLCSRHVELITGKPAMAMRDVIRQYLG
jgi:NAD(P)H dehydrogenase (quinone)